MKISFDRDEVYERGRGAFVGMAVGDALGATVEFMTVPEIRARYGVLRDITGGGWLRLKPGEVTDDTQMALCIARAIVNRGEWSVKAIAEQFACWLKSRPADCGDTCRKGIRSYILTGSLEVPPNTWGAGNGAVMRLLPAALYSFPHSILLRKYVVEQARLTHNNPMSDTACICIAEMIHMAMSGAEKSRLRSFADNLVASFPEFCFTPYRGLATGYVVDTLQTVFHWFFRGRSFEECLVGTVNQGGDADTTGAICGMLAGAYYGNSDIPVRWLNRMNHKTVSEIDELATLLIDLSFRKKPA